jgi:hypothetical protein
MPVECVGAGAAASRGKRPRGVACVNCNVLAQAVRAAVSSRASAVSRLTSLPNSRRARRMVARCSASSVRSEARGDACAARLQAFPPHPAGLADEPRLRETARDAHPITTAQAGRPPPSRNCSRRARYRDCTSQPRAAVAKLLATRMIPRLHEPAARRSRETARDAHVIATAQAGRPLPSRNRSRRALYRDCLSQPPAAVAEPLARRAPYRDCASRRPAAVAEPLATRTISRLRRPTARCRRGTARDAHHIATAQACQPPPSRNRSRRARYRSRTSLRAAAVAKPLGARVLEQRAPADPIHGLGTAAPCEPDVVKNSAGGAGTI